MAIISPCRGSTEEWKEANPILCEGEVGIERKDDGTCITRIGDGEHSFFDLPVLADSGSFPKLDQTAAAAGQAAADASAAAEKANEVYERLKDTDASKIQQELSALGAQVAKNGEETETAFAAVKHQLDHQPRKKTSFRYLRDCLYGSSSNNLSLWTEGQVWANGENIASGIVPDSSHTIDGGYAPLSAYTDGQTQVSGPSDAPQRCIRVSNQNAWTYLQLDLGEVRHDIDYVKLHHYYPDGRKFRHKLLVSDDAKVWHTLFDSDQQGSYQESEEGRIHYVNPTYLERMMNEKADKASLSDSGWVSLTLLPNFSLYLDEEPLKARRIGNVVEITGRIICKKNNNINSPNPIPVAYLPQEMAPAMDCRTVCQGTDMNRCLLSAYQDPDDPMSASRFGGTNYAGSINGNEWIMVHLTYTV